MFDDASATMRFNGPTVRLTFTISRRSIDMRLAIDFLSSEVDFEYL